MDPDDFNIVPEVCKGCNGSGYTPEGGYSCASKPCPDCDGHGAVPICVKKRSYFEDQTADVPEAYMDDIQLGAVPPPDEETKKEEE